MKKLAFRLTSVIFAIHLVFAYILGLFTEPFIFSLWFLFIVPVVFVLGIAFSRIDAIYKNYQYYSLGKKFLATTKNLWFWILLFFSTLLVVGIIYWTGQLLLPEADISQDFTFNDSAYQGVLLLIIVCSGLYIASIIWIKKTLKNIWDF